MKGRIHSFESLAAVDGEGLRCAVFLEGCPLRCVYCHNPDTWYNSGTETDAQDLVRKISRYKPYFGKKGGVTFSGGEPLLQAGFIRECAGYLRSESIEYAIDTSGAVKLTDDVRYVIDNAQLVILDIKFWDDESYVRYTGHGIDRTLNFLDYLEKTRKRTWLRTVVIPEINDTKEAISRYFPYVRECVEKYELLPFHTMGFEKYQKLSIPNPLSDKKPLDDTIIEELREYVINTVQIG